MGQACSALTRSTFACLLRGPNGPGWDLDQVLAYSTYKEVRLADRRLGLLYYLVAAAFLAYFLGFVTVYRHAYLAREKAYGWATIETRGPAYDDKGAPWDALDAAANPLEQNAAFFPTRVVVTTGQTYGPCEHPTAKCDVDADCAHYVAVGVASSLAVTTGSDGGGVTGGAPHAGGEALHSPLATCTARKVCSWESWCPVERESKAKPNNNTDVRVVDATKYALWIKAKVRFGTLATHAHADVSTLGVQRSVMYPKAGYNTYSVDDLLRLAGTKLSDVQTKGATLQLNVIFKCNLDSDACEQRLQARVLDSAAGHSHLKFHEYELNGKKVRDTYRMHGLRVVVESMAEGSAVSLGAIVLQLASVVGALIVAASIADWFLESGVSEQKHYAGKKFVVAKPMRLDDI